VVRRGRAVWRRREGRDVDAWTRALAWVLSRVECFRFASRGRSAVAPVDRGCGERGCVNGAGGAGGRDHGRELTRRCGLFEERARTDVLFFFSTAQPRVRKPVGDYPQVQLEHLPSVLPRIRQGHWFRQVQLNVRLRTASGLDAYRWGNRFSRFISRL